MTLSLHHTNRRIDSEARDQAIWSAITAIAGDGTIVIDEDIVDSIANLLENQLLTTGETVSAYPRDEDADEFGSMPSYVAPFGPSLLPVIVQDYVRDRLARAGQAAVRLYNEAIRHGIQITFRGKDHVGGSHLRVVNQTADEVQISLCESNMIEMLYELGLERFTDRSSGSPCGETDIETFAKAVDDFGEYAGTSPAAPGCTPRLEAFVASARRCSATHVYWF